MKDDLGPARISCGQKMLFPKTPRGLCAEIGLNWLAAVKLFEDKWLSFNPEKAAVLDEGEEAELSFVGALVVGGCHGDLLRQLLEGLEKPYRYRLNQVYYDWSRQAWRLLPQRQDTRAAFFEWLEELHDGGDVEQLQDIQETIQDFLLQAERRKNYARF